MTQTSFLTGHDPSSLAHFPQPFSSLFLFRSICVFVCAYACVCIRKLTTLHREMEKSEGEKNDDCFVLRASILWCVFLHLFLSFFFFLLLCLSAHLFSLALLWERRTGRVDPCLGVLPTPPLRLRADD